MEHTSETTVTVHLNWIERTRLLLALNFFSHRLRIVKTKERFDCPSVLRSPVKIFCLGGKIPRYEVLMLLKNLDWTKGSQPLPALTVELLRLHLLDQLPNRSWKFSPILLLQKELT